MPEPTSAPMPEPTSTPMPAPPTRFTSPAGAAHRGRRHAARGEPAAAHALAGARLLALPDPRGLLPGGRSRGDAGVRLGALARHGVRRVAARPAVPAVQAGGRRTDRVDGGVDGPA